MKCKCGKEAELQQENIFGEVDELCRDCFDKLGHHEEPDVIEWNRIRVGYAAKGEMVK